MSYSSPLSLSLKEWLEVTGHQREIYDLGRDPTASPNTPTMK